MAWSNNPKKNGSRPGSCSLDEDLAQVPACLNRGIHWIIATPRVRRKSTAAGKMAVKKEKAGFGSFNSGNVEQMLRDPNWQPPPRPAFMQALELPQEVGDNPQGEESAGCGNNCSELIGRWEFECRGGVAWLRRNGGRTGAECTQAALNTKL